MIKSMHITNKRFSEILERYFFEIIYTAILILILITL